MNPIIKEKWIAALRSGEYEQGVGALRTEDHFCCLGVLCDLFAKETAGGTWADGVWGKNSAFQVGSQTYGGFLPHPVGEWAGLPNEDPKIKGRWLSHYNDQGSSFPEIADLIEEYL